MQNKLYLFNKYLLLVISLIVVLYLTPGRNEVFNEEKVGFLSIICVVNVFWFFYTTRKYYKTWVRFDVLFLIGFLIVHFQIPFLASLGIEPEKPSFIWVNKHVVNFATWLSSILLLLWLIGYNLFLRRFNIIIKSKDFYVKTKAIDAMLWVLMIFFIGLVGKDFLSGSYSGTENWGAGATYIFLFLRIILYLRIIYFFINSKGIKLNKQNIVSILFYNKTLLILLFVYCLMFLKAGDRGPLMELVLLILGGYSIYQKHVSFGFLISLILIGSILFTIIREGRTRDASQRSTNILSEGFKNLQDNEKDFNPTDELASSVRILYSALDIVPEKHPYLNGATIVSDLVGVVPFGSSAYISLTNLPIIYLSSSYFFTIQSQGVFFQYGEGSEIIADLYINVGIVGTAFIMIVFGYFISFLTFNALYNKKHRVVVVYLILITVALYLNRSNILTPLKAIVWTLVIDSFIIKRFSIKYE
ncbi:hypothetical protein [Pontibacter vulgaris]|uniref:hypothetical protein n=1 Tax=Pontibacter vulgaris TaxID=2905679 RepID=UPI001FA74627|nr:hypothetical protein [Pontibacter vulgaris]